MGKGLRSAIIVEAVVLVFALLFSVYYFMRGMYRPGHAMDVLLIVAWVLVAAAGLFIFWQRSLLREEMIRRFYLSKDWVYNHEIGYAPLKQVMPDGDAYGFVTFAADSLAHMSYGFEVADTPSDFVPELLISSDTFRFHLSGDGEPDSDDDASAVIDQWEGTLQLAHPDGNGGHTYTELGTYSNARELARLLEDNGAFGANA